MQLPRVPFTVRTMTIAVAGMALSWLCGTAPWMPTTLSGDGKALRSRDSGEPDDV